MSGNVPGDFTLTGTLTVHTFNEDVFRELVESQTEYTEAIAAILDRNPDGPWTLEELAVLTPGVINSGT